MKRLVLLMAVFVGATLMTSAAQASTISTGDSVKVLSTTSTLGGGPFAIDGPDADSVSDFLTFCIELNEGVEVNKSYFVKLSNAAEDGGLSGGNPDPISEQTAFLYSSFVLNTLGAYGYTGDQTSKDALQLALWYFESEAIKDSGNYIRNDGGYTALGNAAVWAKADQLVNAANANYETGNFYDVKVMQLWKTALLDQDPANFNSSPDTNVQDMLIFVPEGASTLSVLMLGLTVVGAAGARFRRVA
jgi:hypothetical protein